MPLQAPSDSGWLHVLALHIMYDQVLCYSRDLEAPPSPEAHQYVVAVEDVLPKSMLQQMMQGFQRDSGGFTQSIDCLLPTVRGRAFPPF